MRTTLKRSKKNRAIAGSMRTISYFYQLPFGTSSKPPKLELRNPVIVAMRIYAETKLCDLNFVYPEVASIVIANEHRRPLAVYNSNARGNKIVCNRHEILS